ncbi:hypothetical protein J7E71_25880 [Mesobacillus foraminis]|uniref:hypothetical protein n=1 Tax=Mesobacillus foraminis TaxID=279826 RepID=UPI001BEC40F6|nr:hypothetical protein [Mesobacillus foraminis]MBT2759301.1 hypothetical protein [Mesobacillus foraminis]
MATEKNKEIKMLIEDEVIEILSIKKTEITALMEDGLPHYVCANDVRFLKEEVEIWFKSYVPSQERLEKEFIDHKGRTLEEYVQTELIIEILRISKTKLNTLCKNGMPHVTVGTNNFFHLGDILSHYRRGDETGPKTGKRVKQAKNQLHVENKPTKNKSPLIFVDGSYTSKNVGTGIVFVDNASYLPKEHHFKHNVSTSCTVICEYLAILDALKLVRQFGVLGATIVTDQESIVKNYDLSHSDPEIKLILRQISNMLNNPKRQIGLEYINNVADGKNNKNYKRAHTLSREYKQTG